MQIPRKYAKADIANSTPSSPPAEELIVYLFAKAYHV